MAWAVRLVNVGDLWHQGVIGVSVTQKRADRQQHLRDGQRGGPLVLKDVEANRAVAIDVAVVNFGRKGHLGGLEGIVGREMDVQEEHSLVVGRVLGSHDRRLPAELLPIVGGAG